ncbi:addiction module toxin RelE [Pantoea vagans]|uniref:Addiction module toxin RelE n=1 Tax=Pantoea vagans TaxID=470934 RepID=A0AAN1NNP6_9GAMM|nr:addiction module toxin RelE [Pantoea vagans]
MLWQGGKGANPQELTLVSDWGEQKQPTPPQCEV